MNKGWPDYNPPRPKTFKMTYKDGEIEQEEYTPGGIILKVKPEVTKGSNGGPSEYYDFPKGALTLNDLIEHKSMDFHLGNIFKAVWRYGTKDGTSKEYDCRKIIYSGARKLMQETDVATLRQTLQGMLDDPQFQERN